MYPVAHVVVAGGAAWSIESVAGRMARRRTDDGERAREDRLTLFDYRFVALGALLPDIIDKPLAWFILGDRVEDNHLVAHTLLFALILGIPGIFLARRRNPVPISLALGVFTHLLCDPVLREPRTMFWPLGGTTFHSTYGKGNGLPANLVLDFVFGSIGLFALWRVWRAGRLWDLLWWGEIHTDAPEGAGLRSASPTR
jgi:hypothetical protein